MRKGIVRWDLLAYIVLFVSTVVFDQSTKLHAQNSLMTWYDQVELRSYRSKSLLVGAIGLSPAVISENAEVNETKTSESQLQPTPNWLDFRVTYVRNPGAAWGSFGTVPANVRLTFFYLITVIVAGAIGWMLKSTTQNQYLGRVALVAILGGAAGNLVDRLSLHYVIDWIHLHWKIFGWEYSFPVFNWADVSINVGIGLLILEMVVTPKPKRGVQNA